MSFKDLQIEISYKNYGSKKISDDFLVPMLKQTKLYKRSVGYFSSGGFEYIADGLVELARNDGKIQLIASPKITEEDINAINLGYQKRQVIEDAFSRDFKTEVEQLSDDNLKLLVELISLDVLDVKIVVTKNHFGSYHDKLGIMEDTEGNKVVFYGSSNSSKNGYEENYEKIRVVKSWVEGNQATVIDEEEEFDSLWNDTNPFVKVYDFKESARKQLFEIVENKRKRSVPKTVELRDYQKEAIAAWKNNGYHGFYVMATGTGKTWTAIFSAKELIKEHPATLVICAPYKHLIKQWAEDVVKSFPKAKIILVSSENPNWDRQISNEIIGKQYEDVQLIIISTIVSFNSDRFKVVISKLHEDKMLIVDEAHRFTNLSDDIRKDYKYMLGLSATPYSGKTATKGKTLMAFFGGKVYDLPIEVALERHFLVPYKYHPIYVHATEEEENRFKRISVQIASCFKDGILIDSDKLVKCLRDRLRIISMAEEKQERIDGIIDKVNNRNHFVVYCGDGKLFNDEGDEIRHISSIKKVLNKHHIKSSQFTAKENMDERMELVDAFNKGVIDALAAIRCLDEGINIPSIKSALILSSNDDYREFVQRRGRILRTYEGKKYADIYDVIVLPSYESDGWAKIELRRFREYARLAMNWEEELYQELQSLLETYGLTEDDVDVYDYEDMEDQLDE